MEKTSSEPSEKSAPTVPPPFDKPADLILRSSDGVDYNVYRCILALASPIFADMWSLPQPTPPSHRSHKADSPDLPAVAIPETAKTLETLLRLIYPLSTVPDFASIHDFKAAFLVAHKYEIDYTKTVLSSALSKYSGLEPLRMYAMAVRYDLPDVARLAARGFLLMQDPLAMVDEVKELDVVAYHRLLVYRARCTNSLKTLGDTSLTSYFKMSSRRATEEVKRVEHDLRRQTVQKAAQEIDKIAELSDGKQECLLDLLTAVAARWRGMLPVFSQIAEQRSEIMALKDRLKATEVARDEAIAQSAKAEDIAASAVQTTEFVHMALGEVKAEVVRLGNRIEDLQLTHKRELDEKQKVLSRLHDRLKALKEKACFVLVTFRPRNLWDVQEAKQKQEIEKLREQAKASAELQHERAASQLVNVDEDGYMHTGFDERGAQELQVDNIELQFSRLEGSQATFERVPAGSSRKRKGSEDDLFVLEENEPLEDDVNRHPVGTPQSKRRAASFRSESAATSAPTFESDWQWRNLAANDKAKTSTPTLPLKLDRKGRPLKPVLCGSRMKFNAKS
ncbi:hypothetical protein ACG7TL_005554 [Trametes sanguinea]